MSGVHDLGGTTGHGRLELDDGTSPAFHEDWQARTFAMMLSVLVAGHFNLDEFRYEVEQIEPELYRRSSYYECWLHALEAILKRENIVSSSELDNRVARQGGCCMPKLTKDLVPGLLSVPASFRADVKLAADFRVGDRVRVRNFDRTGHTRVPRYVSGHVGVIVASHGEFLLSDFSPERGRSPPAHLYNVRFSARELWGDKANAKDALHIELWDVHLERA